MHCRWRTPECCRQNASNRSGATPCSSSATRACAAYRALVYEDPEFYEFFRQLTPIDVIERMQIGSRPSTRSERAAGVPALRSIPWTHAWSQSRYMLPGWFGAGTALAQCE